MHALVDECDSVRLRESTGSEERENDGREVAERHVELSVLSSEEAVSNWFESRSQWAAFIA